MSTEITNLRAAQPRKLARINAGRSHIAAASKSRAAAIGTSPDSNERTASDSEPFAWFKSGRSLRYRDRSVSGGYKIGF